MHNDYDVLSSAVTTIKKLDPLIVAVVLYTPVSTCMLELKGWVGGELTFLLGNSFNWKNTKACTSAQVRVRYSDPLIMIRNITASTLT